MVRIRNNLIVVTAAMHTALFHKALKRGLCHTSVDIDELTITADK